MRYLSMQLLTWGTIAGAVGSALLLTALDSPLESQLAALPRADVFLLLADPPAAGPPPRTDEHLSGTAAQALPQAEPR